MKVSLGSFKEICLLISNIMCGLQRMIPSTMELHSMGSSESIRSDFKKTMSLLHPAELKVPLKEVQLTQSKVGLKTQPT